MCCLCCFVLLSVVCWCGVAVVWLVCVLFDVCCLLLCVVLCVLFVCVVLCLLCCVLFVLCYVFVLLIV